MSKNLVQAIAWFQGVFGINTGRDISKSANDIRTILEYNSRYLCQISRKKTMLNNKSKHKNKNKYENKNENGDKNKSYQLISLFLLAVIHGFTHCFLIGAIVFHSDSYRMLLTEHPVIFFTAPLLKTLPTWEGKIKYIYITFLCRSQSTSTYLSFCLSVSYVKDSTEGYTKCREWVSR